MLPRDFPKWLTVHEYFSQWGTSFCIVDAQSVNNIDTAQKKGYEAEKKGSVIKRLLP